MQIKDIQGLMARCEAKGVEREVNLLMLSGQALSPGDYLMVHLGNAVQKVSPEDAQITWELLDQLMAPES